MGSLCDLLTFCVLSFALRINVMDTPKTNRRNSTRAGLPYEVRPDNLRTRLFTPADSGFGGSPYPRTPFDFREGTNHNFPSTWKFGTMPKNGQSRRVYDRADEDGPIIEEKSSNWSRFWLIWFGLLSTSCSCVAFAWPIFQTTK